METIFYILFALMQVQLFVIIALLLRGQASMTRLKGACFVDTSTLIDGRIMDAARAGFVPGRLVVPRSVLAELQLLADGSDSDKRARARHGLDVVRSLKDLDEVEVTIFDDGKFKDGVDNQLLHLARSYQGSICTIDYNLNKVAKAESLPVLNINELAKNLRMNFLPGERASIMVAQKGNDVHQGVGYMADGTMVVVEQAKQDIGKTVSIEFIRSIQTDAGRMLFARKVGGGTNKTTKTADKSPKTATRGGQAGGNNRKQKSSTRSGSRGRKNPEDKLVELANQE